MPGCYWATLILNVVFKVLAGYFLVHQKTCSLGSRLGPVHDNHLRFPTASAISQGTGPKVTALQCFVIWLFLLIIKAFGYRISNL